ncbi:pyridoxamine 5'-phosphate oxidase [Aquimarina brevivitae]|uniref:Pyridoxine/pyridoxamine 5'-phosphate oxidase n=1 Tax=Aquimarina brevivitae TaxID=323412 RepID=A0A4V2F5R5_9FLAO|nr:pyridoxamine 5'-phosphate oxidase [Aquimarina brevivitae]RZS93739.1 pyridoxamine 5'-phosphate oxidase [Aquimarina brevivitae]
MNRDLSEYRKNYKLDFLEEKDLTASPMDLFSKWFKEVENEGSLEEANAMTLSTLEEDGFTRGRIVLLKSYDKDGFVFYTNYTSQKAKAIEKHNKVGISFFWPNLERQVTIKGIIEKLDEAKSELYFNSRPEGSKLGAWASNQSSVIESREVLENKLAALEEEYKNKEITKPPFWGGYIVRPVEIEFWQGRPNRLHDRFRYAKKGNDWKVDRLAP